MPLMNPVWKLIAEKKYTQNSQHKKVAVFPEELVVQMHTAIELPGYIIPIKVGQLQNTFMLSILPTQQCPYCGQGDVPSLVEVHMKKALSYSEKPIKIKGILKLNESGDGASEIFLMNAEQVI
jgi:hypothetical protein